MNIGDIVNKAQYTAYAIWCNKNNAHIEKQNGQYVVVGNIIPEPTVDEQIAELMAQYEADKQTLMSYFLTAIIENDADTQTELRTEIAELDAAYDSDIAELLSDVEDEEE